MSFNIRLKATPVSLVVAYALAGRAYGKQSGKGLDIVKRILQLTIDPRELVGELPERRFVQDALAVFYL